MNRKIILTAMLVCVALYFPLSTFSQDFSDFVLKEYEANGQKVVDIIEYTGNAEKVVIPAQINGLPIQKIGSDRRPFQSIFKSNRIKIKEVVIQGGIKIIGANAFQFCENLVSVTIPESVEIIERSAFSNCANLTDISLPGKITEIAEDTFSYCGNLRTINIPNGVKKIGRSAFHGCRRLGNIELPTTMEIIESGAFRACLGFTSVRIPRNVKSIGNNRYKYEPGYVAPVHGNFVFYECNNLREVSVDQRNVQFYSVDGVLFDKQNKVLVYFPYAKEKGSFSIPDGVTEIASGAFYFHHNITNIVIPSSVVSINEYTFFGCSELVSITVNENNRVYSSKDGVLFNKEKTELIRFPAGKTGAYTVGDNVVKLAMGAFYASSLSNLSWSDNLLEIDVGALYGFKESEGLISKFGRDIFMNLAEWSSTYDD